MESRLYMVVGGTTQDEEKEQEAQIIKESYLQFKNKPESSIDIKHLRVHSIMLFSNAINKGSGGGIKLVNVKGLKP